MDKPSVEEIAKGASVLLPPEARDGMRLVELAHDLATRPIHTIGDRWFAALEAADTKAIIAAIGGLGPAGNIAPACAAQRDACRAMVEQKLTDRMVEKMDRLESASNRLAGAGILVAVIIAGVELWIAR